MRKGKDPDPYLLVIIRIREAQKNVDPDPQRCRKLKYTAIKLPSCVKIFEVSIGWTGRGNAATVTAINAVTAAVNAAPAHEGVP